MGCMGCSADPDVRYQSLFSPGDYGGEGHLVGGNLANAIGLEVEWNAAGGSTRYELGGRSVDVPSGGGDARPFLPVRLTGPGGTIERVFLFATSYGGPVCVPRRDAEALGLTGHPEAQKVGLSLVGSDEIHAFEQAPARVEILELGVDRVLPVMWPEG